jgi:hypothetical protein
VAGQVVDSSRFVDQLHPGQVEADHAQHAANHRTRDQYARADREREEPFGKPREALSTVPFGDVEKGGGEQQREEQREKAQEP